MPVKTVRVTLTNKVHLLNFKKIRIAAHSHTEWAVNRTKSPAHNPSQLASLNMEVDTENFTYFMLDDSPVFPRKSMKLVIAIPNRKLPADLKKFNNDMLREYGRYLGDPGEDVLQNWRERYDAVITDIDEAPIVIHLDQPIPDRDRIYLMSWDDDTRRIIRYLTKAYKRFKV